jgi:alpha-beta hydrolase superfamily lysophospholipase
VSGPRGAASITVPLLVVQNSADEAAPASDSVAIHQAAGSTDKTFVVIKGATHYYQGQPELLRQGTGVLVDWLGARGLLD